MARSDEYYRLKAEECWANAAKAANPRIKEELLKLAADWLAMIRPERRTPMEQFDATERERGTGQERSESQH